MKSIAEEQAEIQERIAEYLTVNDITSELNKKCVNCMYICKYKWGTETVGPLCPVLWLFDPMNPLNLVK